MHYAHLLHALCTSSACTMNSQFMYYFCQSTQYVQIVHTLCTASAHNMYRYLMQYVQLVHTLLTATACTMYSQYILYVKLVHALYTASALNMYRNMYSQSRHFLWLATTTTMSKKYLWKDDIQFCIKDILMSYPYNLFVSAFALKMQKYSQIQKYP